MRIIEVVRRMYHSPDWSWRVCWLAVTVGARILDLLANRFGWHIIAGMYCGYWGAAVLLVAATIADKLVQLERSRQPEARAKLQAVSRQVFTVMLVMLFCNVEFVWQILYPGMCADLKPGHWDLRTFCFFFSIAWWLYIGTLLHAFAYLVAKHFGRALGDSELIWRELGQRGQVLTIIILSPVSGLYWAYQVVRHKRRGRHTCRKSRGKRRR